MNTTAVLLTVAIAALSVAIAVGLFRRRRMGGFGRADAPDERPSPLRLVRSRHRTLSFRFEPPASWRARVPTRDGKTYAFRVVRAVYETLPAEE